MCCLLIKGNPLPLVRRKMSSYESYTDHSEESREQALYDTYYSAHHAKLFPERKQQYASRSQELPQLHLGFQESKRDFEDMTVWDVAKTGYNTSIFRDVMVKGGFDKLLQNPDADLTVFMFSDENFHAAVTAVKNRVNSADSKRLGSMHILKGQKDFSASSPYKFVHSMIDTVGHDKLTVDYTTDRAYLGLPHSSPGYILPADSERSYIIGGPFKSKNASVYMISMPIVPLNISF